MRASKTNTDGRREDLRLVASPVARAVDALRAAEEHTAAEPGSSTGGRRFSRRSSRACASCYCQTWTTVASGNGAADADLWSSVRTSGVGREALFFWAEAGRTASSYSIPCATEAWIVSDPTGRTREPGRQPGAERRQDDERQRRSSGRGPAASGEALDGAQQLD